MAAKINKDISFHDREAWLARLYLDVFPPVAKHISRMGGSFEEARDIFQDALVIFYERVKGREPELLYKQSEQAYLFGIARHLWNKRFKESMRQTVFGQIDGSLDTGVALQDADYEEVSASRLMHLLQTSGKKCMDLLSAFYYENLNMEKLAERFGFSGSRSATVQKFKCLEKIKETVKEKSIQYEDILE
jgi:DNA-directed RNA polymerase specialized sigma24 family protein